jgi:hypothetical protein
MRRRLEAHLKALLFSMTIVSATLIIAFFFYDAPVSTSQMEAAAQAIEPIAISYEPPGNSAMQTKHPPLENLLPARFKNHWQQVALDNHQVHLKMLDKPLLLSQTTHQTGSEAFDYASFLFEQISEEIHNADLAQQLQSLSLRAQTMGHAIRQASNFRYDGPPSEDMEHLQIRSNILFYLKGLNPNTLITAQYNQNGKLMSEHQSKINTNAVGEDLRIFLNKANRILEHPLAKQYPQTMRLIRQESDMLKSLAQHLTLRWESTLYCERSCENTVATYIRVYTRQTLPTKTLASVTSTLKEF